MTLRRALLLAFAALVLAGTWWLAPDGAATREIDVGLKRALASFATARTLDAIVSAAQGTEISMQPLGVGLTLAPGEALDPINDLIEQFAGLMLAASVAFGVQRVLIAVGGHWLVSALLSIAAIGWVAWQWRGQRAEAGTWVARWLPRALLLLLLIRFAVPLAVLGADAGFRLLMADDYRASQAVLDRSAGAMRELSPPAVSPSAEPATEAGTLERLRRWWSGPPDTKAAAAAPSRIEQWQALIGDAVEHIVRLIVVFLMQTLVLPLLTLWLLLGLVRRLIGDLR